MVYRDSRDPRIAQLKQLLASEPELLERRSGIRREHDALQERADLLGRDVAEAERGGVISTISGWFGGSSSEPELAAITTQLEGLVADERAVDAELATLQAARAELANLEAASFAALRSTPGPLGDELRALDADLALEDELIESIRRILIAGDLVDSVVAAILEAEAEQRSPTTSAGVAAERIQDYVDVLDWTRKHHGLWELDPTIDLPRTQLASLAKGFDRDIVDNARSIATCISRLHSRLGEELRARERHRAELAERQRELVDQAT